MVFHRVRSEDLRDILGMEHELHRKKVLVMINKMKPLDQQEQMNVRLFCEKREADEQRSMEAQKATTTLEQVFSMPYGRFKRLSEALDLGFPDTVTSMVTRCSCLCRSKRITHC